MNIITYVVWVYKQLMDAQHIRVGRYIEIHEIECDRERKNRRYCLVNTGLWTKKVTELFSKKKKKKRQISTKITIRVQFLVPGNVI